MRGPDQIDMLTDYLAGEMSADEMDTFEAERAADPEFGAFCDFMEGAWLLPVREVANVEGESPEAAAARGKAEWDRVMALTRRADRNQLGARTSNTPRVRPWLRTLLALASPVIFCAAWYLYLWHPREATGTPLIIPPEYEKAAALHPLRELMPNPHRAATRFGQTRPFLLPGNSTIQLRPNSRFDYKGDWSPEMTGVISGEGVLDVAQGTTWNLFSGEGGGVKLGPGRYALFNDMNDHVLRIMVARGQAIRGTDTVRVGEGVLIEATPTTFGVVQDRPYFPRTWGREAVDRRELIFPERTFWEGVTGRRPSNDEQMLLISYARRMRDEKRDGGPGMPAGITTDEAIEDQRAFERRAAEKAAVAPPNEEAQTPARPAPPLVTATATADTKPPKSVTTEGRTSCDRCTIDLQRIATLRAEDTVESITPASIATRDGRGRYYVLGARGAIMLFGPDGLFLRRISAPGFSHERRSIIGFAAGPSDSLYIADSSRRVSVLDPNSFISVRTFPLPGALTQAMVAADGRLLLGATPPRAWDSTPNGTNGGSGTPSGSTVRAGDDGLLWTSAAQADADSATRVAVIDPAGGQVLASAVFPRTGVIDWDTYYRIRADAGGGFVVDVFTAQLRRP